MSTDGNDEDEKSKSLLSTSRDSKDVYETAMSGVMVRDRSRWWMLSLLIANTVLGALLYLGFSVIATDAREHFGVKREAINSMAVLGTAMPILTYPFAARTVDVYGIRRCHLIGSVLVCCGAWIRVCGARGNETSYWICFSGQAVISVGMAHLNSLPAAMSNRLFPVPERSLATSIAMLAFLVGMAVGQGIGFLFAKKIPLYLLIQACLLTVPIPLVYLFIKDPRTSSGRPSVANTSLELRSIVGPMQRVISVPSMRWLCVAAMCGIGTFNTILSLIDEVSPPSVHGHESLLSGACFFAPGIIGTVLIARYIDKTRSYLRVARVVVVVILSAFSVLCYAWNRDVSYLIYPSFALIGLVGLALIPLCVELGIELTFDPTSRLEGAVNAVVQTSINFGSCATLYALDPDNLSLAHRDVIFVWFGVVAVSMACFTRISPEYRRLAHERKTQAATVDEERIGAGVNAIA